jgi:WD40 repeat protein
VKKLQGHARGVEVLAVDPFSAYQNAVSFFSADSTREIRRWHLTRNACVEVPVSANDNAPEPGDKGPYEPLLAHETSVYALRFDADGDMWTASADKSAKCLVRERSWASDTELVHPDFVRDVAIDEEGGWIVTACRDEEVRLWERGSDKLFHTFSGHYEEVTGLVLIGRTVVSVSIDGTIRRWSLKPEDLTKAKEETDAENSNQTETTEKISASMLTEEEERELAALAELMDDDED